MTFVQTARPHLALLAFLLLLAASVLAQGPTGEITGVVMDTSQAVIPGATVSVLNPQTGASRRITTNDAGVFTFPALPPGTYRVTVEKEGFRSETSGDLMLQVQQTARLNFSLNVGAVSEKMEVAATAPLLSPEDSTIGQVIDNKRVLELPLNGRNFLQLTALTPGVNTDSSIGGAPGFQGGQRSRQSITIAGQRNTFNHYTLDGVENTDPNFNSYIMLPSIDALLEFKVQSDTYPAEFGFAVSQVNVTTKSGTNSLHGSLFEFLRNASLDAKNYFDDPRKPIPPFKRNQFGATAGGPILKNRLFFFANYEGMREVKSITSTATVPTAAQRLGDLSALKPVYDPKTRAVGANGSITATPFAGNQIPASRIDSIAKTAMENYWPAANAPGSVLNYLNTDPRRASSDQYMARIDFRQTDKVNWFGRWNLMKDFEYTPSAFPKQGSSTTTRPDQLVIGSTQLLRPTLVNDVRFGWNRFDNKFVGANSYSNDVNGKILHIAGINLANDPAFWGIPTFGITGFTGFGDNNYPYLTHNNQFEGIESLSWLRGRHVMKFGVTAKPIHYNQLGNQFALGSLSFDGSVTALPSTPATTGAGLGDFLLGLPYQPTVPVKAADAQLRSTYWAGYFTDSFKITRTLTMEFGIRYEYLPPFKDVNDQAVNVFDLFTANPVLVRASNQGSGRDPYENQFVQFTRAKLVRDGRMGAGLVRPDRNNWAPRLGLAYSLRPDTVIRAAYGVFWNMIDMGNSIYDMNRTLAGLRRDYTDASFPDLTLAQPFRVSSAQNNVVALPQALILANSYVSKPAYVEQFTFDIQRSITPNLLLDMAYVGSQSHNLKKFHPMNLPPMGPGSVHPRRPFQQFGYIQFTDTIGNANYNAFQMKVERRLSHGFTVLSAYTFGKSIDDASQVRPGGGENFSPQNPDCLNACERGSATFDVRNRWVTSTLYELPIGRGHSLLPNLNPVANKVLSGWQMGGILTLQSGLHTTPAVGVELANQGGFSGQRPNATGINPNLAPDQRSVSLWFNKAAFTPQALYTYGNAGRNTVECPGIIGLDMSVRKEFAITESSALEFRGEVFNAPNHPIFGTPSMNMTSSSYGRITSTKIDSREIQFALRLVF